MYIHPRSTPANIREVIAAWIVCLAVAAAVLAYPGSLPGAARHTRVDSTQAAQKVPGAALCAIRVARLAEPRG